MNVVVEGADNTGKSTLVHVLAGYLNWPVVHSDGPLKAPNEFNQRARMHLGMYNTIFDRHTIVSERIYGGIRGHVMTDPELETMFNVQSKIVILCRGDGTLSDHKAKAYDTAEHLSRIQRNHSRICEAYDAWGLQHAHIIYRKGDTHMRVLRMIRGELKL